MTIEIDVEAVAIGQVAVEVDFTFAIVRITIFHIHEGARVDGIFDAGTGAPAVEIEVLVILGRAVVRQDVELGVGVAALGVEQQVGCDLGTDARAEEQVAARVW